MISVIAARDKLGVIGNSGSLPDWRLPADMKRFRQITTGNIVVMGRATFESIGKPLPNRHNIVISKSMREVDPTNGEISLVPSYERAISLAEGLAAQAGCEIFVVGGENVYSQALQDARVGRIILTLVNGELDGDRHFPPTPPDEWKVVSSEVHERDGSNSHDYAFLEYERRNADEPREEIFYYPSSRSHEQTEKMLAIDNAGICPFCPAWLNWYHDSPVIHETEHWAVTPNDNPYTGTVLDLLLISKHHAINMQDLPDEALQEFGLVLKWVEQKYDLDFFGVGVRVGPVQYVSGSVNHLHAHVKVGDVFNPDHKPIRFKLSSRPEANEPPGDYH